VLVPSLIVKGYHSHRLSAKSILALFTLECKFRVTL
jgi:hypothetical protein